MPRNLHIENIIKLTPKARLAPLENAKNHHIENIIQLAPKARLAPLENAHKSSYREYYTVGTKCQANPFGKCPQIILSRILYSWHQKQG